MIWLRRQLVSLRARSTACASGTSMLAVAPVASSWTNTPILSERHGNVWNAADMRAPAVAGAGIARRVTSPEARGPLPLAIRAVAGYKAMAKTGVLGAGGRNGLASAHRGCDSRVGRCR